MLVSLLSSSSRGSSDVSEISFRGPHIASPLTGNGNTAPHQGPSFETTSTQPPPIRTIDDWIRALHTHTHEGFTALLESYTNESCTPCWDVSGAALIRPSQIKHYTYRNWQRDLDVHDCLEGLFKLLQLDPSIALMQQPEMDQMLGTGELPTRWSHSRHFTDRDRVI
jgi:hypothetical protein